MEHPDLPGPHRWLPGTGGDLNATNEDYDLPPIYPWGFFSRVLGMGGKLPLGKQSPVSSIH